MGGGGGGGGVKGVSVGGGSMRVEVTLFLVFCGLKRL